MNGLIETTSAAPYIIAAYMVGGACTYGFALWLYLERVKIERYLLALAKETTDEKTIKKL